MPMTSLAETTRPARENRDREADSMNEREGYNVSSKGCIIWYSGGGKNYGAVVWRRLLSKAGSTRAGILCFTRASHSTVRTPSKQSGREYWSNVGCSRGSGRAGQTAGWQADTRSLSPSLSILSRAQYIGVAAAVCMYMCCTVPISRPSNTTTSTTRPLCKGQHQLASDCTHTLVQSHANVIHLHHPVWRLIKKSH
jgi:hypothetical protein